MATIVITPPKKFSIPKVAELWEAREVLYRFGARDVTLRYRQTLLGVVWVVLQPLLTALVFVLVFAKVAHLNYGRRASRSSSSSPGSSAWNLFSGIITRAQSSLVSNRDLVSKVFFPRMLVPLAVVYSCLVDFVVSIGVPGRPHGHLRGQPGRGRRPRPGVDGHDHPAGQRHRAGDLGADRPLPRRQLLRPLPPAVPALRQPDRLRHRTNVPVQVPGHLRPEPADLDAPGVPVVVRAPAGPATRGRSPLAIVVPIAASSSAGRSSSSRWSAASPTSI